MLLEELNIAGYEIVRRSGNAASPSQQVCKYKKLKEEIITEVKSLRLEIDGNADNATYGG